jgi:ABC-type amino acid transport substrate-binding protein
MRHILVILAAAVATGHLAACSKPVYLVTPDHRSIATDATFPPFHYIDDDANVTGYDIAVAREACDRAGIVATIRHTPDYDQMFADLLDHKVHMIAATTGITPEREKIYLFTEPYFTTCQAALVRAGAGEPRTLADLADKRVGASGHGTSFRAMTSILNATHVHIQPGQSGLDMLRAGDIDALIIDEYEVVTLARANPDLGVIPEPVALEHYAIVLAPDSHDLKKQLDRALRDMRADATLDRLQNEYNVTRPPNWPVKFDQ